MWTRDEEIKFFLSNFPPKTNFMTSPLCSSCGKSGHRRSSSKKCSNFKPKASKKRKLELISQGDNMKSWKLFTIKDRLMNIIRPEFRGLILDRIQQTVLSEHRDLSVKCSRVVALYYLNALESNTVLPKTPSYVYYEAHKCLTGRPSNSALGTFYTTQNLSEIFGNENHGSASVAACTAIDFEQSFNENVARNLPKKYQLMFKCKLHDRNENLTSKQKTKLSRYCYRLLAGLQTRYVYFLA